MEHGVTLKEPKLERARHTYSGLGYPRQKFWIYLVLRNNLYDIEDQEIAVRIEIIEPDGSVVSNQEEHWHIWATEEQTLWWIWRAANYGSLDTGRYRYRIRVDGLLLAEDTFSIP